jgi:hypothetical protein
MRQHNWIGDPVLGKMDTDSREALTESPFSRTYSTFGSSDSVITPWDDPFSDDDMIIA